MTGVGNATQCNDEQEETLNATGGAQEEHSPMRTGKAAGGALSNATGEAAEGGGGILGGLESLFGGGGG